MRPGLVADDVTDQSHGSAVVDQQLRLDPASAQPCFHLGEDRLIWVDTGAAGDPD
jgi:hypothetical protein